MTFERPDLIQTRRTRRNDHLLIKAIIGCLIGLTVLVVLAMAPQAATVDVGIAPPESNAETNAETNAPNALNALESDFVFLEELPLTESEQRMIYDAWTAHGYDYPLALAFADKETCGTFDKNAINHKTHDFGLFQLNRASWLKTFRKLYGIGDMNEMLNLNLNIQGALYVFDDCVRQYGNNEHAIVAYNRGPTTTKSTAYSRDVLTKRDKWASVIENRKNGGITAG